MRRLRQLATMQLDGTYGEGSGQVIRNASPLSVLARLPLRVIGVCAERSTPDGVQQLDGAVGAAAARRRCANLL